MGHSSKDKTDAATIALNHVAGLLRADETAQYWHLPVADEIAGIYNKSEWAPSLLIKWVFLGLATAVIVLTLLRLPAQLAETSWSELALYLFLFLCAIGAMTKSEIDNPYFANLVVTDKRLILQSSIYDKITGTQTIEAEKIEKTYLDFDQGSPVTKVKLRDQKRPIIIARNDVWAARTAVKTLMGMTQ